MSVNCIVAYVYEEGQSFPPGHHHELPVLGVVQSVESDGTAALVTASDATVVSIRAIGVKDYATWDAWLTEGLIKHGGPVGTNGDGNGGQLTLAEGVRAAR